MSRSVTSVGVLSLHNSKETKAILNAVEALDHRPTWLRRENVGVEIRDGHSSMDPDVDVVVNRLLLSNTEHSCEHLGLARTISNCRPMLNPPESVLGALHKFATATALSERGVRVPDALLTLDAGRLNQALGTFGDEVVYKTAIGTHGGGTWKIGADEEVNPRVGDRFAFVQSLVDGEEAENRDLRVYVVDDEIVGAMYRYAPDNDWRTNVALGGRVEAASDLPEEAVRFARRATSALGLDYAGVDLVEGTDGWYVLEVNPTAGFRGLFAATGVSPAPYIAQLAVESAGGEVDDRQVADLAGELDDSEPSSTPAPDEQPPPGDRVVGFTEEVLVSGTSGTQRVIAKSDTGAARTSVDTGLAARIGAGPVRSTTRVRSGSVQSGESRPVVDIVVGVGGDRHTVAASLTDRSHMDHALLLGRDILKHYQVDVDRTYEEEGETEE